MTISPTALATGTARDVQGGINPAVVAYLGISGVVLLLMMLLGLALRLAQAEWVSMPPDLFYEVLTAHGVGMVGVGGLGAALGWPVLLDRSRARLPEPTIVASAMVTIVNTLGW